MSDHDVVVGRIKTAFEEKGYRVQIRGNNLPQGSGRREAIYRPDMLVRSQVRPDILWIVEVETGQAGKSVVGAAALADVCMQIETESGKQQGQPTLIFVFYRASVRLQLAEKRIRKLKEQRRLRFVGDAKVLTENEALAKIRARS